MTRFRLEYKYGAHEFLSCPINLHEIVVDSIYVEERGDVTLIGIEVM